MRKQKFKIKIFLIIFLVSTLFASTFNVTSSRYYGQTEAEANDVVAIPVLTLTNNAFNYSIPNMLPGHIEEKDFYVRNYEDTNTNEILLSYYFQVNIDSVIPLSVYLSDGNGIDIPLNENKKSTEIVLPYNTQVNTKYHIKVVWDESNNSFEYAGKNAKVHIDLVATQVLEG